MDTTFFNSLNETLKDFKADRQNDQQFQMATSFYCIRLNNKTY